jgi:hypothetical protein
MDHVFFKKSIVISLSEIDNLIYETQKRFEWYIMGIGIHGISWELFEKLSTDRIVELYNVEMSFFKK